MALPFFGRCMRRIAFFAHYDPSGLIDDYVIRYLSELLRCGVKELYFSSDCDLADGQLARLPDLVIVVHSTRHGEYDFGSWKRCFCAVDLSARSDIDELILCNDSCYGPLSGFDSLFAEMQSRLCDFWGVTQVRRYQGYYPSYFLVFRRPVLECPEFYDFFEEVASFVSKKEFCLKYEVGLTHALRRQGFQGDCFFNQHEHLSHSSPAAMVADVINDGMPFIRVMTARENPGGIAHLGVRMKAACDMSGYPLGIIRKHLERTSPGYRKFWNFQIGKSVKTYLGIVRIRLTPAPSIDRCRVKVRILGIPLPCFWVSMRYDAE